MATQSQAVSDRAKNKGDSAPETESDDNRKFDLTQEQQQVLEDFGPKPVDNTRRNLRPEDYGEAMHRMSRNAKYAKLTSVKSEIEMPDEMYALITSDIIDCRLESMEEFINQCFRERMRQILTDPQSMANSFWSP